MEYSNCPNCDTAIKDGVFSSNKTVNNHKVEALNILLHKSASAYCDKCYEQQIFEAGQLYQKLSHQLTNAVELGLESMPLVTLQNPHAWEYTVLKMVTAQCVTGEGALTEFTSSWNEFFGTQSNRLNKKLKNGELVCMSKLRLEAIEAGGNAIVGTDIDYAEVGGQKGMLMVCMAGTAIKLNNPQIISTDKPQILAELLENVRKLNRLKGFADLFPQQ